MDKIALKQSIEEINKNYSNLEKVLDPLKTKEKINKLEAETQGPIFWNDQNRAKSVFQELYELKDKYESLLKIKKLKENLELIYEMSNEDESLLDEADSIIKELNPLYDSLEIKLLLNDPIDKFSAILEIHSGAGGTESLDWVSMLYRMYTMYIQKNKFKMQILEYLEGDEVGIKSVSIKVEGEYAYGYLKSESGVHRLVRLSPFDSDHARHTTFASVLVTPLITDDINIEINEADLRIDVFHSSGAGGQSVNTTDSAVRITHLPTKIVVTCQNERSQIQNKETALKVLKSKLYQIELEKRKSKIDSLNNKSQIAFGSQIRSYVFHPYTLVKDHRTDYETTQADKVMDGEIDGFINSYLRFRSQNE